MIVGNHKPILKNVDEAARRRFLIVPFERQPERPDRELEKKLMTEGPHTALDGQGVPRLAGERSHQTASVLAATEEYFSDQDLFVHWLEEDCACGDRKH